MVFKAWDPLLERHVAIRMLPARPMNNTQFQTFRAAALLDCPEITRILDIGLADQAESYLVMEFVDGPSLSKVRWSGIPERIRRFSAVLRAVEFAHRAGVVHHSLNPGNVKLTTTESLKVLDFGLAGFLTGTVAYIAPEQVKGTPDHRADIYALGVMLFELATGRLPYTGQSPAEFLDNLLQQEPAPSGSQGTIAELEKIALRALRKNPDERFASAAEMAAALQALQQQQ